MAEEIYLIIQSLLASPIDKSRAYIVLNVSDRDYTGNPLSCNITNGHPTRVETFKTKFYGSNREIRVALKTFMTPYDYPNISSVAVIGAAKHKTNAIAWMKQAVAKAMDDAVLLEATAEEKQSYDDAMKWAKLGDLVKIRDGFKDRLEFEQYTKGVAHDVESFSFRDKRREVFVNFDVVKFSVQMKVLNYLGAVSS